MPLLVKASVALHAAALLAVAAMPAAWPWALAAVLLNQAVLSGAGLWPRSRWLGDNMQRLPAAAIARREVAITIDDGPDPEITPVVLEMLDAHGAKATFFCIAERASRHPELCRRIVERGHSVQNHSQRHSHAFALLGIAGFVREIGQAQESLTRASGQAPQFFRAPAGLRNPLLAPALHRLDLRLVSWTRRGYDTVQRDPARVLARLAGSLAAGDIVLLHDGNAARTRSGTPVVLAVLPRVAASLPARGFARGDIARGLARAELPSSAATWPLLIDAASAPYRRAGRFAWHFARGKLGMDPVFRHVLSRGLITTGRASSRHRLRPGVAREPRARRLRRRRARHVAGGLGCSAARRTPHGHRADAQRCRARAGSARRQRASSCAATCGTRCFRSADAVVILDALHYIGIDEQDAGAGAACARALRPGGVLLLRVGDAASRAAFAPASGSTASSPSCAAIACAPLSAGRSPQWIDALRVAGLRGRAASR